MNTKHDYLVALIRELENENNLVHLDTFWAKVEGELKMRKRLSGYIDLPISQEQYDILISTAEFLLGITTSGRTAGATSADEAAINMEFVDHILKSYTPDQLTIDTINLAAKDGVRIDGFDVNKQTAAFVEKRIKELQENLEDTYTLKEVAQALDIDYAEIANQDLDQLKSWDEIKKIYNISDAALGSRDDGFHSGAIYSQDDIEYNMKQAPEGYKMIWYFPPFEQYFVGDITDMADFPFIYKNDDPSHDWVVKNTPVVGPFASVKELADYYDVVIHEHAGMDIEFMDYLVDLVTMIKHYQSKNDKGQYDTIIDTLWSKMKTFLLGNI